MKLTLPSSDNFKALSAFLSDSHPTLYFQSGVQKKIQVAASEDGFEFEKTTDEIVITDNKNANLPDFINIRISPLFKNYIMFAEDLKHEVLTYTSQDQKNWQASGNLNSGMGVGLTVENYVYNDAHVFYFGGKNIAVGLTQTGKDWKMVPVDGVNLTDIVVDFTLKTSQGIFVLYHAIKNVGNTPHLEVKALCFDKNNPTKLIWHTKSSLWEAPELWQGHDFRCIGCINFEGKILSYWNIEGLGIYLATYPYFGETPAHEHKHYNLQKHTKNPILTPDPNHSWENEAVFNSAAFYEDGKVYLVYRAVGYGYISVLGYAESSDGVHFEKRMAEPIYTGNHSFDTKKPEATFETAKGYISGGGYGGVEDPRITKIGNKLYMIYVAFNGFDPPRLALTSILYKDFLAHRFLWEKPVLISPPGVVDKSGCILPEKINGKYVIFHRIYPDILIDFLPDLNFDGTHWLKGEYKISPRPTMWDSRKIGTGAPPIKTKDGWLMIYQGVTDNDDSKYKIGAMLLDLADPTKVLYRTDHPIIEPTEHYENGLAKFGVVYPCGAVIKDENLFVYYGGSDSVTCVATANLEEFLKELKSGSKVRLSPVTLND